MNLFRQFVKTTVDVADFHAMRKRAEAAEERLKEAQAEIDELRRKLREKSATLRVEHDAATRAEQHVMRRLQRREDAGRE